MLGFFEDQMEFRFFKKMRWTLLSKGLPCQILGKKKGKYCFITKRKDKIWPLIRSTGWFRYWPMSINHGWVLKRFSRLFIHADVDQSGFLPRRPWKDNNVRTVLEIEYFQHHNEKKQVALIFFRCREQGRTEKDVIKTSKAKIGINFFWKLIRATKLKRLTCKISLFPCLSILANFHKKKKSQCTY